MLLFRPSRTWRCLLSLIFFFVLFFLFPKKAWAQPASSINITDINAFHNIYDICKIPQPNPDTMLLEELLVSTRYTNNGGEGFDSYYIYINKLPGDSKPQNGIDNFAGWWKFGPIWLDRVPNVIPKLFGDPGNANGFSGLISGDRQVRVVFYNSVQGCAACNGYPAAYDTWNYYIDRQPPNYNSDWPAPNAPPKSPKLRTTTPSSSDPYDPAGIVGMDITVEPSSPRADAGNFGLDRFDLWVGALPGDNTAQIKAGNPACAPGPPYADAPWAPWGDLCKNTGPMNCPSFQPGSGVNGQAWFINYLTGSSGGSVNWDTNGFIPGTRVLSGNLFDNPTNRNTQNFRTYTGIGISPYFARVDYNLMPPHAPTANFTSYPPGGIIDNAPTGQNISLPATASDSYGYLTRAEVWVAKRDRTPSFTCTTAWSGSWCKIVQSTFSKRSSYSFPPTTGWTPLEGGTYDVVINAFDQFGEKCTGDPQTPKFSPQWPPVWTDCGFQSWITVNVRTIEPWIKTTGGDVHSNTSINTQGGP